MFMLCVAMVFGNDCLQIPMDSFYLIKTAFECIRIGEGHFLRKLLVNEFIIAIYFFINAIESAGLLRSTFKHVKNKTEGVMNCLSMVLLLACLFMFN